jgi:uncharacterized protein (TIGR02265 family)
VPAYSRDSGGDLNPFREPPWDAPLDPEREMESIPPSAQIRGMFIIPVLQIARRSSKPPGQKQRDRYVPFQFYPLREHARLLIDTAGLVFPQLPLRQGLRKLGRGAPAAFVSSTLGRVVLQPNQGPFEVVTALATGYNLCLKPGNAVVEQRSERSLEVTLEDIHYFIDSHHVGAFEGAVKHAGEQARVRIQRISAAQAVLLVEW